MTGKTLSHFEVLEKLGEGGMGVVYKARDTQLNRFVALKILPAEKTGDPERRRRFMNEARAASALNHPNIVTIYEISQADGVDFIAMEFIAGRTLTQMIGPSGMKLTEALRCAVQIADTMTRAHAVGIVHRDLKPSNVMLTDDGGRVKILDFGLAKLTEPGPLGPDEATVTAGPARDAPLTEDGAILGTVAYMSPEQAEGKQVGARSDVFSFGALLYEMLSGQRAFEGASRLATLAAILNEEPKPISEITPGVPRELEKLIARCLRKDPERRAQHFADLKLELEERKEESESGIGTAPRTPAVAPTRKPRRWLIPSAAAAVLLIAGAGIWRYWPAAKLPETRSVLLTSYSGYEDTPALSPDGRHVAFAWDGDNEGNIDIYVSQVDAGTPVRLTQNPNTDSHPAWSPDGRFLAFVRSSRRDGAYLVIPALGGPERRIAGISEFPSHRPRPTADWTPDSKGLVLVDTSLQPPAIVMVNLETGEKKKLTSPPANSLGDYFPLVSPDGRWLAFTRVANVNVHAWFLLPMSGVDAEPKRLTGNSSNILGGAWSANSRELIYSQGIFDRGGLLRVAVSGSAKPQSIPGTDSNARSPSIARQGGRLAYTYQNSDMNLWRADLENPASPPTRLIASTQNEQQPDFSSDGAKIAFISGRSGDLEVWIADADGSNPVQLTNQGAIPTAPHWSPDNQQIAFAKRPGGNTDVYIVDAQGGAPRRLTTNPANDASAFWSRDSKWVYFASNRTGRTEVWKIPADGKGDEIQVTRNGGWRSHESADGRWIYYQKFDQPGLFRAPLAGGAEERVAEIPAILHWKILGSFVYFYRFNRDDRQLLKIDLSSSSESTVRSLPAETAGGTAANFTISPDGRWLVFPRNDQRISDLRLIEGFR